MHSRTIKGLGILAALVFFAEPLPALAACVVTPEICGTTATAGPCSTPRDDGQAFQDVDKGFVKKLTEVADAIMAAIDHLESRLSQAIMTYSAGATNASKNAVAEQVKAMEAAAELRQSFLEEQRNLERMRLAMPGRAFTDQLSLKTYWVSSEFLTRAMQKQLYRDQIRRTELEHEQFYTDKENTSEDWIKRGYKSPPSYNQGTISGIAKLYQTHLQFFCNATGSNRPPGCGEASANMKTKMGDQMLEIYLGEGTWPREQVLRGIELMQFYLGIHPPDLPNTSDFSTGEGQRAFIEYQGKLAKNNLLTYMLTYLTAKRSPSNEGQATFIKMRKEAGGCDTPDANKEYCNSLDQMLKDHPKASIAELNKMIYYTRIMNSKYLVDSVQDTLGIEKDKTVMMADSLKQDYEAFQMEQMITAALAGYYADLVNK